MVEQKRPCDICGKDFVIWPFKNAGEQFLCHTCKHELKRRACVQLVIFGNITSAGVSLIYRAMKMRSEHDASSKL